MKKIFILIVLLIGLGLTVLLIIGTSVKTVRTEIQISAPIGRVWQVLTDFDRWSEWNSSINQARGTATIGSQLDITIRGEDGEDASNYEPLVVEVNAPEQFRWTATMMAGFVFKNHRVFELKKVEGGTLLVQKEEFSGLLVPLFWAKMSKFAQGSLYTMNKDLKKVIEQGQ